VTPRPPSLQGRLLALVLGGVLLVWGATAVTTGLDVRHELDELLDSHLAQAAALLVVQQQGEALEEAHDVDAPLLHRYAAKVAFQVFHEGRLSLRSAQAPAAPLSGAGLNVPDGFRTVSLDGAAWRVFATHGAERDVRVFVGERLETRDDILWAVLRGTLGPLLLALPLLGLALWWAVRRGLLPLHQLGRALAQRHPQALAPLQLPGAPAEMLPMLDALNALFGRIAALVETERRFTADAAHELRTPIAAIRAQAQVALAEADEPRRRHALQSTLAGCDRATRLVEQLLTLARLESGAAPPMGTVDLAALLRQAVADIAPAALARGQDIALDIDPPAGPVATAGTGTTATAPAPAAPATAANAATGNATLLAVLLRNLLDNAVRYSPPGATVRVALQRGPGGGPRLTVEDSGPGLADADLQRLGERFFRVLGAPAGGNASGSGLGWSIVRRVAAVHGLGLHVARSALWGGLAVTADWPATPLPSR
jgi:two-component system sensor histidine kinase QseC